MSTSPVWANQSQLTKPVDWLAIQVARAEYRRAAESSARSRQAEREHCIADVRHWVDQWCWTEDPRDTAMPIRPFVLRPRQVELLETLQRFDKEGGDIVIEKTRDRGVSWLNVAYDLHPVLFAQPGSSSLHVSAVQDLADDWTTSSLLGKARFLAYTHMPEWLVNPADIDDTFLAIIHRKTRNHLVGRAAGRSLAGPRYSRIHIDEAARLEHSHEVRKSSTSVSRSRRWSSTPRGRSDAFASLRFTPGVQVFTYHWSHDPHTQCNHGKGEPHRTCWYARVTATMPREDIASELDISYDGSVHGLVWPDLNRAVHVIEDAAEWAEYARAFRYCRAIAGIDIGTGPSATAVVLCYWAHTTRTLFVDWCAENWRQTAADWGRVIGDKVGEVIEEHGLWPEWYADPSAWQTDPMQRNFATYLENAARAIVGPRFSLERAGAQSDRATIGTMEMLTRGMADGEPGARILFGPNAIQAYSRCSSYRWDMSDRVQWDVRDGNVANVSGWKGERLKPRKDEASHMADALLNVIGQVLPVGGHMDWMSARY